MGLARPAAGCVVHGDLHFRQVLVEGGELSGVIDWGDVCRGDPSVDFPLYWSSLTTEGRAEFRRLLDAYHDAKVRGEFPGVQTISRPYWAKR